MSGTTKHRAGSAGATPQRSPVVHPRWGGFAEELIHYTSRYYAYTEAFIRQLSSRPNFSMVGYQADTLSQAQRHLMAAILCRPPSREGADAVATLVADVIGGRGPPDPVLMHQYRQEMQSLATHDLHRFADPLLQAQGLPTNTAPLDPFLALADRLLFPALVDGRHVDVSLRALARHLDSPVPQVRNNLRESILWLHEAGYRLRNHHGLTHATGAARLRGGACCYRSRTRSALIRGYRWAKRRRSGWIGRRC